MILAVTFEVKEAQRAIVSEAVGKVADICYLADLGAAERKGVLRCALANCRRALMGETPLHLVPPDERVS
jgi:hypothetical protein